MLSKLWTDEGLTSVVHLIAFTKKLLYSSTGYPTGSSAEMARNTKVSASTLDKTGKSMATLPDTLIALDGEILLPLQDFTYKEQTQAKTGVIERTPDLLFMSGNELVRVAQGYMKPRFSTDDPTTEAVAMVMRQSDAYGFKGTTQEKAAQIARQLQDVNAEDVFRFLVLQNWVDSSDAFRVGTQLASFCGDMDGFYKAWGVKPRAKKPAPRAAESTNGYHP